MEEFYVYVFMDPEKRGSYSYDGLGFCFLYEPFYIGKGKNNRIKSHMYPSNLKKQTYFYRKINKIISENREPIAIKLYENLKEKDAYDKEIYLIKKIGKSSINKGTLSNISDGGDGVTLCGKEHPNWGKHLKESTKKKYQKD